MKFGETLHQRSIPQWAHYNIDYDELKHLIKERTTNPQTSPVSIPGQGGNDHQWTNLEDELFVYLSDQHDRVNLFARSKYGEIERRLDYLNKQLRQLGRQSEKRTKSRVPIQHSRKFRKLVEEAEDISEEIQSLSRYTNTQRLAFKKILKKYRKWTGSSKLDRRMNNEVFNKPSSFLQPDFTPLLSDLSALQAALRHISEYGIRKTPLTSVIEHGFGHKDNGAQLPSSLSRIDESFRNGNAPDIDAALATAPLGPKAGRAVYWVHPDNIAEVRVLLLRHMRDHSVNSRPSLSRAPSSTSMGSRHGSISSASSNGSPDNTNVVLFDDLDAFVKEQNAATLDHNEDHPGSCASRVMMHVNWTKDSKHALINTSDTASIHPSGDAAGDRTHHFQTYRVRRKDLDKILPNSEPDTPSDDQASDLANVQTWIKTHPSVSSLAHITSKRSRFEGLNNGHSGLWATMDQTVTMSSTNSKSLLDLDDSKQSKHDFPHAILELRWEESSTPEIVDNLNESYLAERVRGFSLQLHAIYAICAPPQAAQPFWVSLIDKDIRKVPSMEPRGVRSAEADFQDSYPNAASTSAPSTTDGPSGGGFSSNHAQSSATSMENVVMDSREMASSRSQKKKAKIPRLETVPSQSERQRYWNEFDDGSEGEGNDVYTIYIDPNESFTFPGFETISKAAAAMGNAARNSGQRLQHWLKFDLDDDDDEPGHQPLLQNRADLGNYDIEDSSDSSEANTPYGTVSYPQTRIDGRVSPSLSRKTRRKSRETGLLRTYIGCFTASYILLIVTSILQATGRRKAMLEVDVGVVVGIVGALCFGITGVSMMVMRRERLSWVHRLAVLLAFSIVCVGSGLLLALIGNAL